MLPVVPATSLGVQLWSPRPGYGAPCVKKLRPWANGERSYVRKPDGGLWTSTFRKRAPHSAWERWVAENTAWALGDRWLCTPTHGDVLRITNSTDLTAVIRTHPLVWDTRYHPTTISVDELLSLDKQRVVAGWNNPVRWARYDTLHALGLDFEAIARAGFVGVHLTARGAAVLHLPLYSPLDLNSWDCESTVWNTWVFDDLRPLERRGDRHGGQRA